MVSTFLLILQEISIETLSYIVLVPCHTTRRTGGIPGTQQRNTDGGIGQCRPVVTNNFVSGRAINSPQKKTSTYHSTTLTAEQQNRVAATIDKDWTIQKTSRASRSTETTATRNSNPPQNPFQQKWD